MAQLLVRNGEAGGASFVVDLPARGQVVARLSGDVDWTRPLARATYAAVDGSAASTEYEWDRSTVIAAVPGLEAAMAADGRGGVTWASRPLDPTTTALDAVFALIFTLSSDRPENPQLLVQAGARSLGRRTVDGQASEGFRYSPTVTYWVGVSDGLIHRVDARFKTFSDPLVLRLTRQGPRTLRQPQRSEVVDASTIPDIYQRLTGHPAPTTPTGPASTTTAPAPSTTGP